MTAWGVVPILIKTMLYATTSGIQDNPHQTVNTEVLDIINEISTQTLYDDLLGSCFACAQEQGDLLNMASPCNTVINLNCRKSTSLEETHLPTLIVGPLIPEDLSSFSSNAFLSS